MEAEYELTIDDILALRTVEVDRRPVYRRAISRNRWIGLIAGLLCLLGGLLLGSWGLIAIGLMWLLFGATQRPWTRWIVRRSVRSEAADGEFEAQLGRTRLRADSRGLEIRKPGGVAHWPWSSIRETEETEEHLFLWVDGTHAVILPKREIGPEGLEGLRDSMGGIGAFTGSVEGSSGPRDSRSPLRYVWLGAALGSLLLVVGCTALIYGMRNLGGFSMGEDADNTPLRVARRVESAWGEDLGVDEASGADLPEWIPRHPGVEVEGFLGPGGGGLLMGTAAASAEPLVAFYRRELPRAGLSLIDEGSTDGEQGGVVQARSEDGCRWVLVAIGEESGRTEITYQFRDCSRDSGASPGES